MTTPGDSLTSIQQIIVDTWSIYELLCRQRHIPPSFAEFQAQIHKCHGVRVSQANLIDWIQRHAARGLR